MYVSAPKLRFTQGVKRGRRWTFTLSIRQDPLLLASHLSHLLIFQPAVSAASFCPCRRLTRLYVGYMEHIPPPILPFGNPDRHLMCQMALELSVQDIVEAAVKTGWREAEALSAITEIADNLMLVAGSNAEIDALMGSLKKNQ